MNFLTADELESVIKASLNLTKNIQKINRIFHYHYQDLTEKVDQNGQLPDKAIRYFNAAIGSEGPNGDLTVADISLTNTGELDSDQIFVCIGYGVYVPSTLPDALPSAIETIYRRFLDYVTLSYKRGKTNTFNLGPCHLWPTGGYGPHASSISTTQNAETIAFIHNGSPDLPMQMQDPVSFIVYGPGESIQWYLNPEAPEGKEVYLTQDGGPSSEDNPVLAEFRVGILLPGYHVETVKN